MVQGVPAIGVMTELIQLCALYGAVEEYRPLDEYPAEEFTEVYLVKFQKLTSARFRILTYLVHYTLVSVFKKKKVKVYKRKCSIAYFVLAKRCKFVFAMCR